MGHPVHLQFHIHRHQNNPPDRHHDPQDRHQGDNNHLVDMYNNTRSQSKSGSIRGKLHCVQRLRTSLIIVIINGMSII